MNSVMSWLLEGDPAIQYLTRLDLLKEDKNSPVMQELASKIEEMDGVKVILEELKSWPGRALKSHKDAKHLTHKLAFLADLGFTYEHKKIAPVIDTVLAAQSEDGPFNILINIPKVFGGTGKDSKLWMFCDAGVILYSLIKMGLASHPQVEKAFSFLLSLLRENGWPCAADSSLGNKFKGPGKRTEPCPYTNLLMLRALSIHPEKRDSKESQTGIQTLFDLWDRQREHKPFLFAMGTDFKKLKYPFIWYDILFAADVLSHFETARVDDRMGQMARIIGEKENEEGRFKAESVWQAFKDWDFGQKRESSRWITFLVHRLFERLEISL